jgi:lysophospholipase L1-like esterase
LKERPLATVVINSLLPRGNEERLYWWDDYTAINEALACYAAGTEQVEFFNATDLFVTADGSALNMTLLPDQVHPEELGSWVWGRAIVAKVQEILDY